MASYLITGGAGFIGSHIAAALLESGHRVRVIDDLVFGKKENLAGMDLEFVEGSILDESLLNQTMSGMDGVFHEAALPSVPRSVKDPLASHEVNSTGTLRVLMAARDAGAKVVFAASSSAYGDTEVLPKHEDMPVQPLSPYAVAKVYGEQLCSVFGHVYDMETVILRYFNVFGPRQREDSPYSGVIAKFCAAALNGEEVHVDGDGMQSRDFTYVTDVARGNLLAMETSLPPGTLMNLAGGGRFTLLDLLDALEKILGKPIARKHGEPRTGDVKHSQASVDKAKALMGFETAIGFQEGLQLTLDWYRTTLSDSTLTKQETTP